jgi:hypothetical protein
MEHGKKLNIKGKAFTSYVKKKLIGMVGSGVQLGPLGTAATNSPLLPAPSDYDGEIGGT